MNTRIKNRFHMLKVVQDTCAESIAAINSIPACKDAYIRLEGIITKMEDSMKEQIADHTGLTKEKKYLKQLLADMTVMVAGGLESYAHNKHDYSLEGEMHCSLSQLMRMTDDVMVERCKVIQSKANDLVADLSTYAIDATLLTAFLDRIKDFEKICPKVSEAVDARKLYTATLDALLVEATDLLKHEMDHLIVLIDDSHATFKKLYKNSRAIDDYRGKRNAPPLPEGFGSISGIVNNSVDSGLIEDALVSIEELNLTASTDEDGEYYFEKVPAGVYTLKVSAETYNDEMVKNVEVIGNAGITVDVGMNSVE